MLAVFPDHWAVEPQWRGTKAGREGRKRAGQGGCYDLLYPGAAGRPLCPPARLRWAAWLTLPAARERESPGPPGGRFTKWSTSCSEGRSGAPLAVEPEGGAALRGGVQAQHPHPLKPKGDFHCVQRHSGPCSLCWGTRLRLDQTASCACEAWSPGHPSSGTKVAAVSLGCRLPARPPNPGAPRKTPPRATREAPAGDGPHVATAENKTSLPARC